MTKTLCARFATLLAMSLVVSTVIAQSNLPELPLEAKKRLDHHVGEWDARTKFLGRDGQVVRTATARDTASTLFRAGSLN